MFADKKRCTLRYVGILFVCCLFLLPGLVAQAKANLPSFEVASIRPVGSTHLISTMPGQIMHSPVIRSCIYLPDRVICQQPLVGLIAEAYQTKPYLIISSVDLKADVFAVQAVMPVGTTKATAQLMLRALMKDRFGLQAHFERRVISVDALIIGKHGSKLTPAPPLFPQNSTVANSHADTEPSLLSGPGVFIAKRYSLDEFCQTLATKTGDNLPVINMSGLTGMYKFDMHWNPDMDPDDMRRGRDTNFLIAIQQQLGLRVVRRRAPYNVLVVDHINKWLTPN